MDNILSPVSSWHRTVLYLWLVEVCLGLVAETGIALLSYQQQVCQPFFFFFFFFFFFVWGMLIHVHSYISTILEEHVMENGERYLTTIERNVIVMRLMA